MRSCLAVISGILIMLIPAISMAADSDDMFPMEKGTVWIYKGNVKWTVANSNKVKSARITWKTRIVESQDFACCRIAIVEGMIEEVSWYEPGKKPLYSLLVKKGNLIYNLSLENQGDDEADNLRKAREFANEVSAKHETLLNAEAAEPLLDLPLSKGKRWAQTDDKREDGWYCWNVKDVMTKSLNIRGVPSKGKHKVFRVAYHTNPDHQIVELVPGVGIVRRIYEHHGTVAFSDMRLAEFVRGK